MKSWLVKELGEPSDVLRMENVENPERGENEVLIQVRSVALNFFDILLCQGKYQEKPPLPFSIGSEVSGIVVQVKEGSKFKEGQRVLALPQKPHGGLAEYVSVDEASVYPIPESMSWNEAASMFITYHTTYYALFNRANIQKGEVLLVHAGAGGVGSAAIQLGKAAGAYVIATAGGSEKTEICRQLGADVVIDYLTEDFVEVVKRETDGKGADVIYDPVGGDVFDRSRKCIAFDGRILVIGFAGGQIPSIPANHVLVKNYSVVGVHWGYFNRLYPEKVNQEHEELISLYEQGKIKPLIYKEFDFQDVPDALNLLATRKTWGKVVVKV
ncbi:NADPH:quinone oxidoreductase family protein [Paenibacillus sp. BSR1-1]|uniref:NADPH:quinone oxidoreductase family protein n=1 Tax=Paenibacillus sp. BSR1-1 TaxID=3020845 RepID=UPI0025B05CD3|nr:NADPH:quinone oxidoreductase family protein [Paenibacillus sp. BSR1-1]MDN3016265.1 NADPH:quinone oxidoreductase family protein [Paenibacillus sp. BSR1-1]